MKPATLLAFVAVLAAQSNPSFEEVLAKIAVYEVGDDQRVIFEMNRLVALGSTSPEKTRQMEQGLIQALEGKTSLPGKDQISRQLMLIGSAASVPAVVRLLGDPVTADTARYALERIPGPAVNEALRDILPKSSGRVKVGVVNTLGSRRDDAAVPALRGLLGDSDVAVATAAAAALGRIGDSASAAALAAARPRATGALRAEIDEAYLRCADLMAERGDRKGAIAAYNELAAPTGAESVRIAALRGFGQGGGMEAVPALVAALQGNEPRLKAMAIRQLTGTPEGAAALGQALPSLDSLGKVQALAALADRGDKSAIPAFLAAAKDTDSAVRATALLELGKIGDASVIGVLAEAASKEAPPPQETGPQTGGLPNERRMSPSGALSEPAVARESLAQLRGADIDKAILAAIPSAQPRVKVEMMTAASERGIGSATPVLLQAAADADREVRRAALRGLRNIAPSSEAPALLAMLGKADAKDRPEVARVISSALRRSDTASVAPVMSAYNSTSDAQLRGSLLAVLAEVGRDESLPVLRSAIKDSNPEIQRAAIRALAEWPNSTPMADLKEIAASGSNPAFQVLALQGYIRLIGLPDPRPPAQTVRLLAEAITLAKRPDEKRAALAQLQLLPIRDALAAAEAAAKDSDIAAEANAAAQRIRQRMAPRQQQRPPQ